MKAGYVGWDEYERNQKLLAANTYGKGGGVKSGRGGKALLSGSSPVVIADAACASFMSAVASVIISIAATVRTSCWRDPDA
jgi:hypothetical protein